MPISEPDAPAVLEVEGLTAGYGRTPVINGVSLSVKRGQTVALLGRNGAGKSTCLKAIAGLLTPTGGSVRFKGRPIHGLPSHRIARLGLGYVREGRRAFPDLTVRDNLLMGGYRRRDSASVRRSLEQVFEKFEILRRKANQRASLLSGGEQQVLVLGQMLMLEPELLILDEPSLGLAPIIVRQIFEYIASLQEQGVTILLVEQLVGPALALADYAYLLDRGEVKVQGKPDELLATDVIGETYLGSMQSDSGWRIGSATAN